MVTEVDVGAPPYADAAREAFLEHLRQCDPQQVMFRHVEDGAPITAPEMITLVEACDSRALHFLQDIVGAALRAVRVRTKGEVNDDKETTRLVVGQLQRMFRHPR